MYGLLKQAFNLLKRALIFLNMQFALLYKDVFNRFWAWFYSDVTEIRIRSIAFLAFDANEMFCTCYGAYRYNLDDLFYYKQLTIIYYLYKNALCVCFFLVHTEYKSYWHRLRHQKEVDKKGRQSKIKEMCRWGLRGGCFCSLTVWWF